MNVQPLARATILEIIKTNKWSNVKTDEIVRRFKQNDVKVTKHQVNKALGRATKTWTPNTNIENVSPNKLVLLMHVRSAQADNVRHLDDSQILAAIGWACTAPSAEKRVVAALANFHTVAQSA